MVTLIYASSCWLSTTTGISMARVYLLQHVSCMSLSPCPFSYAIAVLSICDHVHQRPLYPLLPVPCICAATFACFCIVSYLSYSLVHISTKALPYTLTSSTAPSTPLPHTYAPQTSNVPQNSNFVIIRTQNMTACRSMSSTFNDRSRTAANRTTLRTSGEL